jgi:hypothetical protein
MIRKPLLRTVMLAGTLFSAGGAPLHQLLHGPGASATGATPASIREWIQLTLAHTSPAQLVEGVGVVWFILVLALLLRSRTHRAEPLDRVSLVRGSPDDEYNVPRITAPPDLPRLHRSLLELLYTAGNNLPTDSAASRRVNGNSPGLNNGHLLALTRIMASPRWCMPYGLFVVAQYVGATSNRGKASRPTVDVIVSQVAPLPADDTALANEHLCPLFEMAVLRATYMLRHNGIGTPADVRLLVAGIMVVGNDIYVVSFGH